MLKLMVTMVILYMAKFVTADRKPVVTLILGLWNIRRGELVSNYKRTFEVGIDVRTIVTSYQTLSVFKLSLLSVDRIFLE